MGTKLNGYNMYSVVIGMIPIRDAKLSSTSVRSLADNHWTLHNRPASRDKLASLDADGYTSLFSEAKIAKMNRNIGKGVICDFSIETSHQNLVSML